MKYEKFECLFELVIFFTRPSACRVFVALFLDGAVELVLSASRGDAWPGIF